MKYKSVACGLCLTILVLFLTSCAEVVKVESEIVNAEIVSVYHRASYAQPIIAGKVRSVIVHPARNEVTVKYDDVESTINDIEFYNKCKDNVGTTTECELVVRHYSDGNIKKELKPR